MNALKLSTVLVPLLLAGCSTSDDNKVLDSSVLRGQATPPGQEPQPVPSSPFVNPGAIELRNAIERDQASCHVQENAEPGQARQESLRTLAQEEARRQNGTEFPDAASPADWKPSEGDLVFAGQKVMELKAGKGGAMPTHSEMAACLQEKMGLPVPKVEKILKKLGV